MAVLSPVRVLISNASTLSAADSVHVPDFPSEPDRGSRSVPFDNVIYIDADDFCEQVFVRLLFICNETSTAIS